MNIKVAAFTVIEQSSYKYYHALTFFEESIFLRYFSIFFTRYFWYWYKGVSWFFSLQTCRSLSKLKVSFCFCFACVRLSFFSYFFKVCLWFYFFLICCKFSKRSQVYDVTNNKVMFMSLRYLQNTHNTFSVSLSLSLSVCLSVSVPLSLSLSLSLSVWHMSYQSSGL